MENRLAFYLLARVDRRTRKLYACREISAGTILPRIIVLSCDPRVRPSLDALVFRQDPSWMSIVCFNAHRRETRGVRCVRGAGPRPGGFHSRVELHCSRVHRGAAPIVSYVSALLIRARVCVRARVCECSCVRPCELFVWVRLWACPFLCECVHASWHPGQRV